VQSEEIRLRSYLEKCLANDGCDEKKRVKFCVGVGESLVLEWEKWTTVKGG
jgi:hypothetical protein